VVLDAYAPTSKGVLSVSDEWTKMRSTPTPSTSAAICARMVSLPVPRSVAPTSRLKVPSSFAFTVAEPMSSPGMPVPCIANATPFPSRVHGFDPGRPVAPGASDASHASHPDAARTFSQHSESPFVLMIRLNPAFPSPSFSAMGSASPFLMEFERRNWIGSNPIARATSSMWDSRAK
jgi:hypothetical protein